MKKIKTKASSFKKRGSSNAYGWRCPNCGRGCSPTLAFCDCSPIAITGTTIDIVTPI